MKVFHRFLYYSLLLSLSVLAVSCKKKGGSIPPPTGDTTTVNPQVDPPLANTIGFFMDDWQPRTFTVPSTFTNTTVPAAAGVTVTVDRSNVITKVPRSFASNNANLWMGQMVTETSLMTNITNLHPHLIRFPGGSISDVFSGMPSLIPRQLTPLHNYYRIMEHRWRRVSGMGKIPPAGPSPWIIFTVCCSRQEIRG